VADIERRHWHNECQMADIVLTTLNARFAHCAFGLRYLLANMGALRERTTLLEFDIKNEPAIVADTLLAQNPRMIGMSIYIWNVKPCTELAALLKQKRPGIVIVLGGPEVSFGTEDSEIYRLADFIIAGEGDFAFAELCGNILEGRPPAEKIIRPPPADLDRLILPYPLYNERDIRHRLVYVETSRGCPNRCEYCISSLDTPLRFFPMDRVLQAFEKLLGRGVRTFKFVDRTFNLRMDRCLPVMQFFLDRLTPGLFLHFEMVPDRFPPELREMIRRFPSGTLNLEIGVQTFNPDVSARIQRKQDMSAVEENLRFLRHETNAQLHADLIAGLPGESIESFSSGFDRLCRLQPHRIQVGILKRLHGTPIARHDAEWDMAYDPSPPYAIIENRLIDRSAMKRIRQFARFWELVANRGRFPGTLPLILARKDSPFDSFMALSDWMGTRFGRDYAISLLDLAEALFSYLTTEAGSNPDTVAEAMWKDYHAQGKRRDRPGFLKRERIGD